MRVDFATPGRSAADPVFACLGAGSNGVRRDLETNLSEHLALVGHATSARGRFARGSCRLDNPGEFFSADGETDINVEDFLHAGRVDLHLDLEDGPVIDLRIEVYGSPTIGPP
jgi:hypothetical protein